MSTFVLRSILLCVRRRAGVRVKLHARRAFGYFVREKRQAAQGIPEPKSCREVVQKALLGERVPPAADFARLFTRQNIGMPVVMGAGRTQIRCVVLTTNFRSVRRCLFPSPHRVYFADVVFADIFTSFAKVLGDVWLSVYMLLPSGSLLAQPAQDGLTRWVLPTIMR